MPKKKSGFPYEVHPTPVKGKDGRNIVYARPARGLKLDIDAVDDYCQKHYETKIAYRASLSKYSARKQLEAWTKGENPKLMRSKMGQLHIYTEI